ncbi:class I SAM-dependent methyltransferase [Actinophytocola gossypii]|uniref:class I SAM-dependent methyltransferase n=1 Tax=Actinophytocola gossypii TaxID=2812003 RepID=UPI0021A5923C|nr:class I SAM-dependent methyltransferase [Actinophytocola gossypii]
MSYDPADHYERLAENYDDTWGHRPEYVAWMNQLVFDKLRIQPSHRIADIGAGTGLFLRSLMERVTGDNPIVCIDPSRLMLEQLPDDPRLHPVCASAEAVATGEVELPYDRVDAIVIKETVHHFPEIPKTLGGLAERLAPGGRLLVVTLPPRLEYPLFTAALDRFAEHQPEPEFIADSMRDAGLDVTLDHHTYTVEVDAGHYAHLVARRWMSVLSTFDDEELAAGLDEMRSRNPAGELRFPDRFAFVLGRRV